ncbi:MAG: PAS domain S-box protein [Burkholderiaceae bacterium]
MSPHAYGRLALFSAVAGALLSFALPAEAAGFVQWVNRLAPDAKERLWLSALSGLMLGLAIGFLIYELRTRSTAIALRRLTELASSLDGRMPEESRRERLHVELERLSNEVLYTARRVAKQRKDFDERHAAWDAQFAASLDAILVLDAGGRITQMNPAAERLFRIKADETIGIALADVLLPPDHRPLDNAAFMQDLAAGKAQGRRQEIVVHCAMRQFPIELAIAEFTNGDERGLIATARDISTHRQTRADLKRVREQADRLQARLRSELTVRRSPSRDTRDAVDATVESQVAVEPAHSAPFTADDVCGDAIRRLAVKAERKRLGFRYEDSEVQGLGLIGDATRLQNVVVELVERVIRTVDSGEVVVHLAAVSTDGQSIELSVRVISTSMNAEQALRIGRPLSPPDRSAARSSSRAAAPRELVIDVAGTAVAVRSQSGRGTRFAAKLHYAADLSHVAIDLGAPERPAATTAGEPDGLDPQLVAEFVRAALRLRQNAEKLNLGALWAQAHRLTEVWLPLASAEEAGLVTALAHTARGGDAANARHLARRLADALDATVRQHVRQPESVEQIAA